MKSYKVSALYLILNIVLKSLRFPNCPTRPRGSSHRHSGWRCYSILVGHSNWGRLNFGVCLVLIIRDFRCRGDFRDLRLQFLINVDGFFGTLHALFQPYKIWVREEPV